MLHSVAVPPIAQDTKARLTVAAIAVAVTTGIDDRRWYATIHRTQKPHTIAEISFVITKILLAATNVTARGSDVGRRASESAQYNSAYVRKLTHASDHARRAITKSGGKVASRNVAIAPTHGAKTLTPIRAERARPAMLAKQETQAPIR